jgi:mRNA interferase MazF
VTSNISRVYPFQVLLPANVTGLEHDSKAQAEQVRSISVERIGSTFGEVPQDLMAELDEALRLHLAL